MILDIPYTKPSITELESRYVADAMAHGWGERCYEYIERFESDFKSYIGTNYALATSSATGALWLGYAGLGISRGDEVIMADINWIATAAPLIHMGAKIVLVDVDPVSWCISPTALEAAITQNTKAIVVTHLYGNLADMSSILEIGKRYQIPVVEDAAEALGSMYQGSRAGSMGEFGVFSFHGTKVMTTGEGGMLVTNNRELYVRALTLSNHGRSTEETKVFWPSVAGFKFKMSNIQAALGCAQLSRIDDLVARKRQIFQVYSELLKNFPDAVMNPELPGDLNSYWMPTIVFGRDSPIDRDSAIARFIKGGIRARPFFWQLSLMDFMPSNGKNPNAELLSNSGLNLPSYHDMSFEDQERISQVLTSRS